MSTAGLPWVKVYTRFLDDPKVNSLTDLSKLMFLRLVIIAGECDAEGALVKGDEPMTAEDIARRLRIRKDRAERELDEISKLSLIYLENKFWIVTNFAALQGRSQNEKRKLWRERQAKNREKRKTVTRDNSECHASVTRLEGEREKERDSSAGALGAKAQIPLSINTPSPRKSKADPRSSHPAIQAFRAITNKYPPKEMYDQVILAIGDVPKCDLLRACREEWLKRGYNANALTWAVEWYATGIPAQNWPARNGAHKPAPHAQSPGDVAMKHLAEKYGHE